MDIKCEGLSILLMCTALLQAGEAQLHVLKTMHDGGEPHAGRAMMSVFEPMMSADLGV